MRALFSMCIFTVGCHILHDLCNSGLNTVISYLESGWCQDAHCLCYRQVLWDSRERASLPPREPKKWDCCCQYLCQY
ncbi:hypothetical protein C8R44DRAFT_800467, partial [Mycena epipterygia]